MDINEALILLNGYLDTLAECRVLSEKDLDIMNEIENTIGTFVRFAKNKIESM